MNSRAKSISKKSLVAILVATFSLAPLSPLFTPNTALAQEFNLMDVYESTNGFGAATDNKKPSYAERQQKDNQASQSEAQKLQEQQKKDEEECIKQNGLQGAFSLGSVDQAISGGFSNIFDGFKDQVTGNIKEQISGLVKDKVTEEVPNLIKNALKTQLTQIIKQNLPTIIDNNIRDQIENYGSVDKELLKQQISSDVATLVKKAVPAIASQSIKSGLPGTLSSSLQKDLPNLIIGSFKNDFSRLSQNMPTLIENNIGDNLRTSINNTENASGTPIGNTAASAEAQGIIMNQMMKMVGKLLESQADTIAQQLAAEIGSSIGGSIDENGLGMNLDSIGDSVAGEFDSLGGKFDSYIDGTLDKSLNAITGTLDQSLGRIIDPIGKQLDGLIEGVTDPIIKAVEGSVNDIVSTVTGSINEVVGGITNSITESISGVTDQIVNSVTEPITNSIKDIQTNITDNITKPITDSIKNITKKITSAITKPITGAVDKVVGTVTSLANPDTYLRVPTASIEQPGDLIDLTTNIKDENIEIKKNLIKTCMHVKATERVQKKIEKKEFSDDPKALRQANAAILKASEDKVNYLKSGYETYGANAGKGPLFVTNYKDYIEAEKENEYGLFLNDLREIDSPYSDKIRTTLEKERRQTLADALKPTISESEKEALFNNPKSLDPQRGMELFGEMFFNENNRFLPSYSAAKNELDKRLALAEQNAREQVVEGYLPNRECTEKDGPYCRTTSVVTPAKVNADIGTRAVEARDDVVLKAREAGEYNSGDAPNISEIANFKPTSKGGGGGFGGGLNISSLIQMFMQAAGGIGGILGGGGSNSTDTNTNTPPLSSNTAPAISTKVSISTLTQVASKQPNTAILDWSSVGATSCKAGTDWYSRGTNGVLLTTKKVGDTLEATGQQIIDFPIPTTGVALNISGIPINSTVKQDNQKLNEQVIFNLGGIVPKTNDTISLSLNGKTVSYKIVSDSIIEAINGLQQSITGLNSNSNVYPEFQKYLIEYKIGTKEIVISRRASYIITCTNTSGESSKSFLINR